MSIQLTTAIVSAITWCCMVALAVKSFQRKRTESEPNSPELRRSMLSYIVTMTLLSTSALIEALISTTSNIDIFQSHSTPFIVLGADGLMVSAVCQWLNISILSKTLGRAGAAGYSITPPGLGSGARYASPPLFFLLVLSVCCTMTTILVDGLTLMFSMCVGYCHWF